MDPFFKSLYNPEFPIVSSSSSMLEEADWANEEPKECNAKLSVEIFLRLPQ
jgi:hypothetical protein